MSAFGGMDATIARMRAILGTVSNAAFFSLFAFAEKLQVPVVLGDRSDESL